MMYGLSSLAHYKSRVRRLLLAKVSKLAFEPELFVRSIRGHTRALAVHFQALLGIAGALCESAKSLCSKVRRRLPNARFIGAVTVFESSYLRQGNI